MPKEPYKKSLKDAEKEIENSKKSIEALDDVLNKFGVTLDDISTKFKVVNQTINVNKKGISSVSQTLQYYNEELATTLKLKGKINKEGEFVPKTLTETPDKPQPIKPEISSLADYSRIKETAQLVSEQTTKLADNSEIIAMRSTGMGFNRLLRPYMVSAGVIALLSFVLGAFVIPHGNVERLNFDQQYIHKKKVTTAENVQLQVDTGVVAYIQHFDNDTKTGFNFSLDKFSDKKLVSHLTASSIQYDTLAQKRYKWKIRDYEVRELHGLREKIYKGAETDSIIMMEPSDFMYSRNQQETLTSPELYEFIEKQKMRGAANLSMFEVEFYKRFASPFAAFILTVIGVSLSCQKRKGGMGLSLGIGFIPQIRE